VPLVLCLSFVMRYKIRLSMSGSIVTLAQQNTYRVPVWCTTTYVSMSGSSVMHYKMRIVVCFNCDALQNTFIDVWFQCDALQNAYRCLVQLWCTTACASMSGSIVMHYKMRIDVWFNCETTTLKLARLDDSVIVRQFPSSSPCYSLLICVGIMCFLLK
jgi:hypothetical protein